VVSALLFIGAASAALAAGGPDALVPFSDVAGAATTIGVGFVIDFGGSAPTVSGCVDVPPTDNGYQALDAFAQQEHLAAPQFDTNGSGLLCSVDGIPAAPACGQAVAGGYQFWSYWYMADGSGTWTYANRGASAEVGSAANGQDVEGWRFQNPGPDNASAPAPSVSPDYANLCASVAPSPTTVPAPATTVPPAVTGPTSPPTVGGSSTPKPSGLGAGSSTPTTATVRASTTTMPPTLSTTTTRSGGAGSTRPNPSAGSGAQSLRATDTAARQGSGGGTVPALVGALVLLILTAGAVFGWRRRARTQ
jgi:hypothetical protein